MILQKRLPPDYKRAVPIGRIVKKKNGEYETIPLTLKEKIELQNEIDRGANPIISRADWEEMSKDKKFLKYIDRTFKEMQAKGEIDCNPKRCGSACCKGISNIGEPDVSEYEVNRIAKHTGLHPECFTKYITPAKEKSLWKSFYLNQIKVLKRKDDPCLFLSETESQCLKYKHACLVKKKEILRTA